MKQKVFVLIATVITLIVNGLANVIPYNNKTTAEISDSFAVYFVPAGYVFAIWGLIYIAMIAYTYYQFQIQKTDSVEMNEIASWYIISALANSVWIFLWHYEYIVSTIFMMLLLLFSLINIYLELKKIIKFDKKFFWMVKATFSVYLGWISVATIANVTDVLFALGFTGGEGAQFWALGMIIIASILGAIMIVRERDYIFSGVIIWALIGIGVKFNNVGVIIAGVMTAITIILGTSLVFEINQRKKKKNEKGITDKGIEK
jgi:hypothetical protein